MSPYFSQLKVDELNTYVTADQLINMITDSESFTQPAVDEPNSSWPLTTNVPRSQNVPFNPAQTDPLASVIYNPPGTSMLPTMIGDVCFEPWDEYGWSNEIQAIPPPSTYCTPVPYHYEIPPIASPKVEKPLKKKSPKSPDQCTRRDWMVRDTGTGKLRPPLLHEFLRQLLADSNFSHIAEYVDRHLGTFKFYDKDQAAKLWQEAKGRNCESGQFSYSLRNACS